MLQYYYEGIEISENIHCWKTLLFWLRHVTEPVHKDQDAPAYQWKLVLGVFTERSSAFLLVR